MRALLVIFPFLFMTPAAATPFGDVLANFTNGSVQNIGPYFPDVNWHESGYIRGWIDIVGFRDLIWENDTDFVPGNASDFAIVQYDTVAEVPGSVTKLLKSVQVLQANNFTIATLAVDLYWKSTICDKDSCWEVPQHNTAQFQDSEKSPQTYNRTMKGPLNVTVAFYNNSYSPKAVVSAGKNNRTFSERYIYNGMQIEHLSKKGYVRTNGKGVKYITYYDADIWESSNETLFSRMDDGVVINTVNFSLSNLTVTAVYPYGYEAESKNYNYSRIDYSWGNSFSPAFFFILLPIFITYWVAKKSIGRIL